MLEDRPDHHQRALFPGRVLHDDLGPAMELHLGTLIHAFAVEANELQRLLSVALEGGLHVALRLAVQLGPRDVGTQAPTAGMMDRDRKEPILVLALGDRHGCQRLGITGNWAEPYLTMDYHAEAVIAGEFQKFLMNGTLYQGSKPVMWSPVEQTALAEAEVEYHDKESFTIWVKFKVTDFDSPEADRPSEEESSESRHAVAKAVEEVREKFLGAYVVIWTTTPWTIPSNKAVVFGEDYQYGLYEITDTVLGLYTFVHQLQEQMAPETKFSCEFCIGVRSTRQEELTHSISPVFQQAAFDEMKLNLQYEIWETPPDGLESLVASMRSANVYGANVTMPYKERIMRLLDSIDHSADMVGAVNTVVKSNGRLIGYNTDGA